MYRKYRLLSIYIIITQKRRKSKFLMTIAARFFVLICKTPLWEKRRFGKVLIFTEVDFREDYFFAYFIFAVLSVVVSMLKTKFLHFQSSSPSPFASKAIHNSFIAIASGEITAVKTYVI